MYSFTFSFSDFLSTYWQKQPTVIKGGFSNFEDPISPDELAGLAMEPEVDSRYVARQGENWQVEQGPLTFDNLPEDHWSFMVQAANHWHPGAARLVSPFRQMPGWLFDDLMISYSTPGGGVGPHFDQYDVFIIQGSGKRRWRVGPRKDDYQECFRHPSLRQITGFEPIIDEVLEPGDILYIPAGFPHDGYALENAMSYSMGFRSPKQQELLSSFADFIIENELGDVHYENPDLPARAHYGELPAAESQGLISMMQNLMQDPVVMQQWLGEYLSLSRHNMDVISADPLWQGEELASLLMQGETLFKIGGLRAFYHQGNPQIVYIDGEQYPLPEGCESAAHWLCNQDSFSIQEVGALIHQPELLALLTKLVNMGYWHPAE
ncbi:cupin domain-containing protein [Photobacterium sp. 1_MG-2023]|uniref:ribosomal protein uL16 3-hydroxylase n=1 Tax=Photobacterium sp. 1_MG-2023 TaxID=3062646 RepID=UPI0026E3A9DF|nr:cupin domain-containing protein [Photobacterium sp. 1_MG-2023]MDO6705795.1 cupin domain-containing protein [Photobacterium sp. 1_MG-2023]